MPTFPPNPFNARVDTDFNGQAITYYHVPALNNIEGVQVERLPFSIRILLESLLRQVDGHHILPADVEALARWRPGGISREIPFKPARVVLQDFTGVPVVVDLAALRDVVSAAGGDPGWVNPLVPVDLVIDHSVQVDQYGTADALAFNTAKEYERNHERYRFLKWAQGAFDHFRVVPPDTGIVHQVNLEYLATVVATRIVDGRTLVFPDTVVGTDSHTTMINGLGVLGWGVGGIEAEANMLGQPLYFASPDVVGVKLTGRLPEGSTATDLALTITQLLRQKGVVGKFVEFFGTGLSQMSLADRATVANMAPEYGATMGYFPVDKETLAYLAATGRDPDHVARAAWYLAAQGLLRTDDTPDPWFSDVVELDLGTVEPSLAGPKRPQDRVPLSQVQSSFRHALSAPVAQRGFGLQQDALARTAAVDTATGTHRLAHGSVVLAAITSCTNTSNPSVMLAAGLVAHKAVARGLTVPPYVKTSLAPGSRVVTGYLEKTGLLPALNQLGFAVVGYGCTTCIGNSGPLASPVADAIQQEDLTVAAVLSGNRNFEGRVHPLVRANYLASPPLVVAYALAGTVDIDLLHDPLGVGSDGQPVYLRDIWPSNAEIDAHLAAALEPTAYRERYLSALTVNPRWNALEAPTGDLYAWDPASTYIQEPPFFDGWSPAPRVIEAIRGARVLAVLGDSVTTDHISPAGNIAAASPAGQYLIDHRVPPAEFNSYGARRGNHQVMMRGTFANIRIRNLMLPGIEGGQALHLPDRQPASIFEVAMRYQAEHVPLVILAGKEYGSGSSRDWAAKGPALLGVKAVIAESFERIHRSNLVGMGILPLQYLDGENAAVLGLTGYERFDIAVADSIRPGDVVAVRATTDDGRTVAFDTVARLDTAMDVEYYRQGGILPTVLRSLID